MNKTVFYPGNAPADSLDNKLWLPDIVTYASDTLHFACILHYLSIRSHTAWAGTTRRKWSERHTRPAPRGFDLTAACTTRCQAL